MTQPGTPSTVAPYPLRFSRRWMLVWQGRLDGRRRQPDPLLLSEPVATGMRAVLLRELAAAWTAERASFTQDTAGQVETLHDLCAELAHRRQQLAAAERELAELASRRPDPAAPPERRLGEQGRPEAVVRARRDREHDRAARGPQQRVQEAQAAIPAVERRYARQRAAVLKRHQQAVDRAWRLHASYLRDQAVYDQALLRRHPEGDLLRDLLDTGEPELPDWTRRPPELPDPPAGGA